MVIVFAAGGAIAGDNIAYLLGWRFGRQINDRFFTSEKAKKRIAWAHRQVEERGGELIVVARFIPGGRTVVTLSAGTLRYPWRKFIVFDAIAGLVWALTPPRSATSAGTPSRSSRGRGCCSRSESRSPSPAPSSSCAGS